MIRRKKYDRYICAGGPLDGHTLTVATGYGDRLTLNFSIRGDYGYYRALGKFAEWVEVAKCR